MPAAFSVRQVLESDIRRLEWGRPQKSFLLMQISFQKVRYYWSFAIWWSVPVPEQWQRAGRLLQKCKPNFNGSSRSKLICIGYKRSFLEKFFFLSCLQESSQIFEQSLDKSKNALSKCSRSYRSSGGDFNCPQLCPIGISWDISVLFSFFMIHQNWCIGDHCLISYQF